MYYFALLSRGVNDSRGDFCILNPVMLLYNEREMMGSVPSWHNKMTVPSLFCYADLGMFSCTAQLYAKVDNSHAHKLRRIFLLNFFFWNMIHTHGENIMFDSTLFSHEVHKHFALIYSSYLLYIPNLLQCLRMISFHEKNIKRHCNQDPPLQIVCLLSEWV